uniref:Uncharacterized protein n=1 Tax=Noctiluca scintillans TaxID=2966 RepID=A0A7S0ZQV0_NOCSC
MQAAEQSTQSTGLLLRDGLASLVDARLEELRDSSGSMLSRLDRMSSDLEGRIHSCETALKLEIADLDASGKVCRGRLEPLEGAMAQLREESGSVARDVKLQLDAVRAWSEAGVTKLREALEDRSAGTAGQMHVLRMECDEKLEKQTRGAVEHADELGARLEAEIRTLSENLRKGAESGAAADVERMSSRLSAAMEARLTACSKETRECAASVVSQLKASEDKVEHLVNDKLRQWSDKSCVEQAQASELSSELGQLRKQIEMIGSEVASVRDGRGTKLDGSQGGREGTRGILKPESVQPSMATLCRDITLSDINTTRESAHGHKADSAQSTLPMSREQSYVSQDFQRHGHAGSVKQASNAQPRSDKSLSKSRSTSSSSGSDRGVVVRPPKEHTADPTEFAASGAPPPRTSGASSAPDPRSHFGSRPNFASKGGGAAAGRSPRLPDSASGLVSGSALDVRPQGSSNVDSKPGSSSVSDGRSEDGRASSWKRGPQPARSQTSVLTSPKKPQTQQPQTQQAQQREGSSGGGSGAASPQTEKSGVFALSSTWTRFGQSSAGAPTLLGAGNGSGGGGSLPGSGNRNSIAAALNAANASSWTNPFDTTNPFAEGFEAPARGAV